MQALWQMERNENNRGTLCRSKKSRIKETLKKRDGKGNVISTREVYVPATTYFYETHRKCKYCSSEDILKSSKTKKNQNNNINTYGNTRINKEI